MYNLPTSYRRIDRSNSTSVYAYACSPGGISTYSMNRGENAVKVILNVNQYAACKLLDISPYPCHNRCRQVYLKGREAVVSGLNIFNIVK